jgi:hypothetical protein
VGTEIQAEIEATQARLAELQKQADAPDAPTVEDAVATVVESAPKRWPDPVVISSDDCVVTIDDVDYTPHVGETVTVTPGFAVGSMSLVARLQAMQPQILAADSTEESNAVLLKMSGVIDDVIAMIAPRIVSWTWTNAARLPLQNPPTEATLRGLDSKELMWLLAVIQGQANQGEG